MPFAASSMMDEEKKKQAEQGGGVNVSGTSTTFSTGVPGQEASSKPQKGSGAKFANIQSYLDANQSQGNRMGSEIAGTVEANAQDAQAKTQSLQSQAPKVEAYDPNEAYEKINQGMIGQADKEKYNSAKAGYKGPEQLDQVQGYQEAQKATQKAATQVQNAGTEQGQRQLLRDQYWRPSYTSGENALDQTLVQNAAGSRAGFENLGQKYGKLNELFDSAATNVGTGINESRARAAANQKAIAEGEVAQMSGLMDPIRKRASEQTAQNAAYTGRVGQDITDDALSEETLAALGLSDGQRLWDLSLSNYFAPDYTQVGVNNAATAAERQKYALLTDLIDGKSGSELTADGKAINPFGFDRARFEADLAAKQAEFERFAKDRTYYGRSGNDRVEWEGALWSPDVEASANLAAYLGNGNTVDTNVLRTGGLRPRDAGWNEVVNPYLEQARQQVRDQIAADLNTYKYDRRVKKG